MIKKTAVKEKRRGFNLEDMEVFIKRLYRRESKCDGMEKKRLLLMLMLQCCYTHIQLKWIIPVFGCGCATRAYF